MTSESHIIHLYACRSQEVVIGRTYTSILLYSASTTLLSMIDRQVRMAKIFRAHTTPTDWSVGVQRAGTHCTYTTPSIMSTTFRIAQYLVPLLVPLLILL